MACSDFITDRLNQQYEACLHRARRRRTAEHWARYRALAGRSVDEAAAIVGDAYHPDHNAVAAALLAAHRDHPPMTGDTEIVVLLVGVRPLVLLLDPTDRHHDSRAAVWASVARRLSALEPAAVAASPVPFLVALLGRLRPDAHKHPSEPRPGPVVNDATLERLLARTPDPTHDVAAVAIARIYLDAVRRQGAFDELAHYAVFGRVDGVVHPSRVARQRRRMAAAIGYVA